VDDLVGYLAGKGVQIYRASGAEVTTHCWWCDDGDPKRRGKLYLNVESWLYDCKRCGARGNRRTLLRHFGDEDDAVDFLPGQDPQVRREILTAAAALAHEMLLGNEKVMGELLGRGLSPETIVDNLIGYVPQSFDLSGAIGEFKRADLLHAGLVLPNGKEFFSDSVTIPYLSHGTVVQLREKKIGGKYRTPMGDNVRLYNADTIRAAERVVITEGEFDALILQQHLRAAAEAPLRLTAVVGIAGADALPSDFDSYFNQAKRVYIALDPDDRGRAAAVKIKALLGGRARIIHLPRDLPKCDWTEYLRDCTPEHPHGGHTWLDVRDLLMDADLSGKRLYSISETWQKWERAKTASPGIKLGWPTLDSVIKPGLLPGHLAIPLAKTGAGKSVFLSNVVHNTRSHRVLFISLELTAIQVFEMLRRIHFFWNPDAPAGQMLADYGALRIVDENRLRESDLAAIVAEYTEDVGDPPELLLIDYLGYFARGVSGSTPYEKASNAVMALKAEAKQAGAAIISPGQVNRSAKDGAPIESDDARDSGVIEETGDFVMSLYRPDLAVGSLDGVGPDHSGSGLNLTLLKSRHGGRGRTFTFAMSHLSLAIVERTDPKALARVEAENQAIRRGIDYESYRRGVGTQQMRLIS
jgi:hypothetical protein